MRNVLYHYALPVLSGIVLLIGIILNLGVPSAWQFWVSILLLIGQVIMLEIELAQIKSGHPRLDYRDIWIERKIIDLDSVGSNSMYVSFGPPYEERYPSTDNSFEEDDPALFTSNVTGILIGNDPKNRNRYSVAEKVVARITFFTNKGNVQVDGRWWIRDKPLYPPEGTDFEFLRKTNIEPGDPKRLVIAYKVKDGNLFYPFGYDTFNEMARQRQDVNLGKGNIKFQVIFEGINLKPTPPMKFLLDGSYENITIKKM